MAQYLNREQRTIVIKLITFFNLVRWFNLILFALTLYLVSYFLYRENAYDLKSTLTRIFFDVTLHRIVICSVLAIAAGYIINAYYDLEIDLANERKEVILGKFISRNFGLNTYFLLNFITAVIAVSISFHAFLAFACFMSLLFFYSHKLRKMIFVNHLSFAVLCTFPFLFIVFYFHYFNLEVANYAVAFFLILIAKDLMKGTELIRGNLLFDYRTVASIYGTEAAKWTSIVLLATALFIAGIIISSMSPGLHMAYLITNGCCTLFTMIFIGRSNQAQHYYMANQLIKMIIVSSVLSLLFKGF